MFRRITTKWVLAVLASVVVPFVGFAWYVDVKLAHRLSWDVVRYYLLSLADDLADRIDDEVTTYREDTEQWADDGLLGWAIEATGPERARYVKALGGELDRFVASRSAYDLVLVLSRDGRYVVSNHMAAGGSPVREDVLQRWESWDYKAEPWFREALVGETVLVDNHLSPLFLDLYPEGRPEPEDYHIGFATPVRDPEDDDRVIGAVYSLVNWTRFQDFITEASRREFFQGMIGADLYASSYAWLWSSDADTILAHPQVEILGRKVSEAPIGLPQLVTAARSSEWGMYPEYEFRGDWKNAAFRHCAGPDAGGFGWIVGIGINNSDIYATVNELRDLLFKATALVVLVVVLWTFVIARRTTRPIQLLEQHTRRVASGDLDARIDVQRKDELGSLAAAFNQMTADLRESREQLVRAEKEAAWREMARQVAHEIKNPLTPIRLSVGLLRRARDDDSPEFDAILDRTIDLIERQVDNMRNIATDFAAFAGARRLEPRELDLRECVDEVVALNAAWAGELGVEVAVDGEGVGALADREELRRVLINLVSNALEAMPDGGSLAISIRGDQSVATIDIDDTGVGLSEEARGHLFVPYFTTRTHGTGLGLAICKRIVDEMGGEISLVPRSAEEGGGTRARVRLPRRGSA